MVNLSRNRQGVSMVMSLLITVILAVIVILIGIYFFNWSLTGAHSIIDCESKGGVCQASQCIAGLQTTAGFKCSDDIKKFCCFGADGQPVTGTGVGSGTAAPGHSFYVYDTPTGESVPLVMTETGTFIVDQASDFYFLASGKDVGVCYASIMYLDSAGNKKLLSDRRIKLSRDQCLGKETGGLSANKLTFTPSKEHTRTGQYKEFYLEFIVFDKKYGTTLDKFDSPAAFADRDGWIGSFSKKYKVITQPCVDKTDAQSCKSENTKPNIIEAPGEGCIWCDQANTCLPRNYNPERACGDCGLELTPEQQLRADYANEECIPQDWLPDYCKSSDAMSYTTIDVSLTNDVHHVHITCKDADNLGDVSHYCGCDRLEAYWTQPGQECADNPPDHADYYEFRTRSLGQKWTADKVITYMSDEMDTSQRKLCVYAHYYDMLFKTETRVTTKFLDNPFLFTPSP